MVSFTLLMRHLLRLQLVLWPLYSVVSGLASFTNPPGPDAALHLSIGEKYNIEWENAGTSYSELSLGLWAAADGNIFWLISNKFGYTSQNYEWTVQLGNGITLSQGNVFAFIMVNSTNFGLQVFSHKFTIQQNASSSSSSSSLQSTKSSSATTTLTSSVTSTPAATTSSSTNSPINNVAGSSSGGGLSLAAKAGIIIAALLVAVLLSVALCYFRTNIFPSRKRLSDSTTPAEAAASESLMSPAQRRRDKGKAVDTGPPTSAYMDSSRTGAVTTYGAHDSRVHEMDGEDRIYEAP